MRRAPRPSACGARSPARGEAAAPTHVRFGILFIASAGEGAQPRDAAWRHSPRAASGPKGGRGWWDPGEAESQLLLLSRVSALRGARGEPRPHRLYADGIRAPFCPAPEASRRRHISASSAP